MAFEKCSGCGEMVASLKRHFCMGKSSEVATETQRQAPPEVKPKKGREKPKSPPPAVAPVARPSETKSKRGRPRIGEQRAKPWEALNMSERTYYRNLERQAKAAKGEME